MIMTFITGTECFLSVSLSFFSMLLDPVLAILINSNSIDAQVNVVYLSLFVIDADLSFSWLVVL